jgi:N-acetylglutamate synthase-like GNAT family acetyltransferase
MKRMDSEIRLRPAQGRDRWLIRRSVLGAGLNPLHMCWKNFILAENVEGRFLGCGQIKPHTDGSRELASVYVKPEWRGRGVASAIIEKLLADRSSPVWLTCRRELTDFYARYGFVEIHSPGNMPAYFRRVKRLIGLFSVAQAQNPLAVMCWRGD